MARLGHLDGFHTAMASVDSIGILQDIAAIITIVRAKNFYIQRSKTHHNVLCETIDHPLHNSRGYRVTK